MSYIDINGRDYWLPCTDCKDHYCSSCAYNYYIDALVREQEKRASAEFKIETELMPRIEQEKRSYDFYITTDKAAEWCDCFSYKIEKLIDMFDEDFINDFDFDTDDIYGDIAKLIVKYKKWEKNNNG